MRIKIDGKVFVQNFDIEYIFAEIDFFPEEISKKVPRKQDYGDFRGQKNRCQFDYFFEEKETVSWLENQCWLLDEEEWSKKSEREIKKTIRLTKRNLRKDFKKLMKNEGYLEERSVNYYIINVKVEKQIIHSLELILKNRKIKIYSPPKNTRD